ncbi:WbqC family protein [Polynucleobacter paneuropaeus]|nr:WbqC family protein [Polynucleobacter paneuropaeus]
MILSIHQPSYFPWLGLLQKIAKSDVFILLDEVQLTDSAFQHRNLFLTNDGKTKFLTIPFVRKNYLNHPFSKLEIANQGWQKTHLDFIINNYKKHPYFSEVFPALQEFYSRDYSSLFDAVLESMKLSSEFFNINTRIVLQSQLKYDKSKRKGELVKNLVELMDIGVYLSGSGAKEYMENITFDGNKEITYDEFKIFHYPQKNAINFVPGLSSLDILFNLGPLEAQKILLHSINS